MSAVAILTIVAAVVTVLGVAAFLAALALVLRDVHERLGAFVEVLWTIPAAVVAARPRMQRMTRELEEARGALARARHASAAPDSGEGSPR